MIARALILALALAAAGTAVHAKPNKELYEMQDRCGKRAQQMFKNGNTGKSDLDILTYQNHYNATLNKCFYLVTETIYVRESVGTTTIIELVDVNENKTYGTFVYRSWLPALGQCEVQRKSCRTESEWRELLKPYMEQ